MIHLLRRFVLAGCFLLAAWYFFYTPAQLVAVRKIDFEQLYQEEFSPRQRRIRPYLRKQRDPGSAAKLREITLKSRPIALPTAMAATLPEALAGGVNGPDANGFVYFDTAAAAVNGIVPALRDSLKQTGYLNAYATTGAVDCEFYFYPEPHSSNAPTTVQYPLRGRAWMYTGIGLFLYGLLGFRRRGVVRHDPLPLAALDLVACSIAALTFGLPLRIYPSTQAALDDLFGGTLWFWLLSALMLAMLADLARRSAYELRCEPERLRIGWLFRWRSIPWAEIADATSIEPEGRSPALALRLQSGEQVLLPWRGMQDYLLLVHHLRRLGWFMPERGTQLNRRFS